MKALKIKGIKLKKGEELLRNGMDIFRPIILEMVYQ